MASIWAGRVSHLSKATIFAVDEGDVSAGLCFVRGRLFGGIFDCGPGRRNNRKGLVLPALHLPKYTVLAIFIIELGSIIHNYAIQNFYNGMMEG